MRFKIVELSVKGGRKGKKKLNPCFFILKRAFPKNFLSWSGYVDSYLKFPL